MPNYLWFNAKTDEYMNMFVSVAERDTPPDDTGDWVRQIEMPAFTRKTYLDGQRKDMQDFKKIAKLQQAAAELPHTDTTRDEIQKEIDGRKKIGPKKTKGL